ncbi:ESX secretion-associated protein EspG [Aldersonia sp. NBC_00410]|uniref:ESX secretion-associated protein EspG n=1 Tax=Aldersonia sp. NBC_00410 TaxID=2975954 RepID=UPI002254BF78|nr:ESX secretion-associated protein EspG [Aldersonia sp. NBC_00410]MCX5046296.1 ESX secretion-associated protein EspG [Aldersonia sp. NBC_00410]
MIAVSIELGVDALLLAGRQTDVALWPEVLALFPTVFYPEEQAQVDAALTRSLVDAGILGAAGRFGAEVLAWVSALGHPDVEAAARVRSGATMLRVCVVRAGDLHVMATRLGDRVVVQPLFSSGLGVHEIVTAALWAALGEHAPIRFEPFTALTDALTQLAGHYRPEEMAGPLRGLGADVATARLITDLAVAPRTSEITMVSHSTTVRRPLGAGIGVFDTEGGRVVSRVRRGSDGRMWSTFAPGSLAEFRHGVSDLCALLPDRDWFGTRTKINVH